MINKVTYIAWSKKNVCW